MKKKILIAFGVIAAICVGYVAFINLTHLQKWYDHTVINGVDVSNKTLEESKKIVLGDVSQYALTINARNDGKLVVQGKDIDFTAATTEEFDNLFKTAHKSLNFPWQEYSYKMTYDVKYDEAKLSTIVDQSDLIAGSETYEVKAPENATYAFSEKKNRIMIKKEFQGNKIVKDQLLKAIKTTTSKMATEVDINDKETFPDMYEKPTITSKDETLNANLETMNQACMRWVNWTLTKSVTETMTPDDFISITTVKDGKAKVSDKKLKKMVEKFCLKYKTVGKKRTFKSHTGKTLTMKGGDYGWRIDYDKAVASLKKVLKTAINADDVAAYTEEPTDANKEKLVSTIKPVFISKGFKLNLDNLAEDYDTQNYTEVDMGAQKAYIFRNGKVKYTFRIISGRNQKGRKTATGAYGIKQKQSYRVLVGADYRTPVHWWARITWTGTGFHGAPWQSWGRWSTSYWRTRGSHGCINMRTSDAHTLYKTIKMNEMVFMHY